MPQNLLKELGRSMTEMLGVLAIVGVLSIAAIFGYSYAMSKYRSNIILNDVRGLTVVAVAQDFIGKHEIGYSMTPAMLAVGTTPPTEYLLTKESVNAFYITGTKIPYTVCNQLIKETPPFIERMDANPDNLGTCENKDNNMVVFFINNDLNQTPSNPDNEKPCDVTHPCTGCAECTNGFCTDNDANCAQGRQCVNGQCSDCPMGELMDETGACQSCSSMTPLQITEYECRKCPFGQRFMNTVRCASCFSPKGENSTKRECDKCPNRVFFGTGNNFGSCMICDIQDSTPRVATKAQCDKCPNRYFIGKNDWQGVCQYCDGVVSGDGRSCVPQDKKCADGEFLSLDNICQKCTAMTEQYVSTSEECNKCPDNTRLWGTTAGYGEDHNRCVRCAALTFYIATPEECNRCSGRTYMKGVCGSCSSLETGTMTKEQCGVCPNRYFVGINDARGSCLPCNGIVSSDGRSCVPKEVICPSNQFKTDNGICYACNNSNTGLLSSQEECGKCGTMRFWGKRGNCLSCLNPMTLETSKQECDKCTQLNFFGTTESDGKCTTCDNLNSHKSTKAQCDKCSERYFVGSDDRDGDCRYCTGTVSDDGRECS